MTVHPIDPRSSLARARMFAPRPERRLRLRIRRVMFVTLIVLPLTIFRFPDLWFVVSVLELFLVGAFAFTDERKKLPSGPARRKECGR